MENQALPWASVQTIKDCGSSVSMPTKHINMLDAIRSYSNFCKKSHKHFDGLKLLLGTFPSVHSAYGDYWDLPVHYIHNQTEKLQTASPNIKVPKYIAISLALTFALVFAFFSNTHSLGTSQVCKTYKSTDTSTSALMYADWNFWKIRNWLMLVYIVLWKIGFVKKTWFHSWVRICIL